MEAINHHYEQKLKTYKEENQQLSIDLEQKIEACKQLKQKFNNDTKDIWIDIQSSNDRII